MATLLLAALWHGECARERCAALLHSQAVNDLEGCTYMSQSLPFGGRKQSGYGRFAGVEGLRGLCNVR